MSSHLVRSFRCSLSALIVRCGAEAEASPALPSLATSLELLVPRRSCLALDLALDLGPSLTFALCFSTPSRLFYVVSCVAPLLALDLASKDGTLAACRALVELELVPAFVGAFWSRLLVRARVPPASGGSIRILLFAVHDLVSLSCERHWWLLLYAGIREHVAFMRAYAVVTTMGGAFSTLRVRREARYYANLLRLLARKRQDTALELRAEIYCALAAPSSATSTLSAQLRWQRGVQRLREVAERLERSELSSLCDYVLVQRLPSTS